jgi:di/tricarboxylate transporter
MKTKDSGRKWMWGFLGLVVALQMYIVWELLAVFALFVIGFAAIAAVVGSLYMLVMTWALAVERLAESRHPVLVAVRQGLDMRTTWRAVRFGVPAPWQHANLIGGFLAPARAHAE